MPRSRSNLDGHRDTGTRYLDRGLEASAVKEGLRSGQDRLAIATVGHPIAWVPPARRFDVWKHELLPHLASPGTLRDPAAHPGGYAYLASRWTVRDRPTETVLLFEKHR